MTEHVTVHEPIMLAEYACKFAVCDGAFELYIRSTAQSLQIGALVLDRLLLGSGSWHLLGSCYDYWMMGFPSTPGQIAGSKVLVFLSNTIHMGGIHGPSLPPTACMHANAFLTFTIPSNSQFGTATGPTTFDCDTSLHSQFSGPTIVSTGYTLDLPYWNTLREPASRNYGRPPGAARRSPPRPLATSRH